MFASVGGLLIAGALGFWLPEILYYAAKRGELDRIVQTVLLPATLLATYFLIRYLRRHQAPGPSAAVFMLLGMWFGGAVAMTIGATFTGSGFRQPAVGIPLALLGTLIPIYAFLMSAYDGSMYALIVASILFVALHLTLERRNWIIPPRRRSESN